MAFLTLRIRRSGGAETRSPAFTDFTVPIQEKMTILDALAWIQTHQAYDLAFRYACRAGMCGTCSVVINGHEGWACRTLVENLDTDVITVEPLRHLPVIKDLVVDMQPFLRKFESALGYFVPDEQEQTQDFARIAPQSKERRIIDANIQCISCGACYSSCTMVYWDKDYLGPAALNRAATLVMDSRDQAGDKRLEVIDGEHGCWRCHSQTSCTEVCPMELRPSETIAVLKRRLVLRSIKSGFTSRPVPGSGETHLHTNAIDRDQAASSEAPKIQTGTPRLRLKRLFSSIDFLSSPVLSSLIFSTALALLYLTTVAVASKSATQSFLFPDGKVDPAILAGALVYEENGCADCHSILGTGGRSAPDLWRVGSKRDKRWLRQVIANPDSLLSNSGMPAYYLTEPEMAALLEYLHSLDFSRQQAIQLARSSVRGGGELYRSGCLECHRVEDLGKHQGPASLSSDNAINPLSHPATGRETLTKLSDERLKEIAIFLSQQ